MSEDTEWFEGRQVDDLPKLGTIIPKWVWTIALAGALAFIFAPLSGCATEVPESGPRHEVCMVQILGPSETGMPVVEQMCVSHAEFEASQK